MKKKLFICILLIAAIALSSCSLVVKDPAVDAARTIIDVDGNKVNKAKVIQVYNANYERQLQMAASYKKMGMNIKELTKEELLDASIQALIRNALKENKIEELKLSELTDEELKKLEEDSKTLFENWKSQMKTVRFSKTELEGEELDKAIVKALNEINLDLEVAKEESKRILLEDKLKKHIIKDVSVSDEEVKAEYDKLVENDKTKFEADRSAYGKAVLNKNDTYYTPSGYRMVKQILIKFEADDSTEINKLNSAIKTLEGTKGKLTEQLAQIEKALADEKTKEDVKKKLETSKTSLTETLTKTEAELTTKNAEKSELMTKAYAKIEKKANEVYELTKNSKFEELIEKYSDDKGMPENGYPVSSDSSNLDKAFVDAAMGLNKVGDISKPTQGIYGYYIISLSEILPKGEVEFEKVAEKIKTKLLTEKQNSFYNNSIEEWKKAAKIQIFKERVFD